MTTKIEKRKSSWYLPNRILEAMNIVKEKEHVNISSQVEIGAVLYLERHKTLLAEHDIDLWTT